LGYYIQVENDVKNFVEDLNPSGHETILFIHGWPANHNMFEYQFNELACRGYRCIGVDTRGFGKSDKPFTGYTYDRLADDIRCIIEALNLRNITLAGHSTGGAIAIRYMARHKGCGVARLALFAAAAPSLVKRPNFPYGLEQDVVFDIINLNRPSQYAAKVWRHLFLSAHFRALFRVVFSFRTGGSKLVYSRSCSNLAE